MNCNENDLKFLIKNSNIVDKDVTIMYMEKNITQTKFINNDGVDQVIYNVSSIDINKFDNYIFEDNHIYECSFDNKNSHMLIMNGIVLLRGLNKYVDIIKKHNYVKHVMYFNIKFQTLSLLDNQLQNDIVIFEKDKYSFDNIAIIDSLFFETKLKIYLYDNDEFKLICQNKIYISESDKLSELDKLNKSDKLNKLTDEINKLNKEINKLSNQLNNIHEEIMKNKIDIDNLQKANK